MANTTIYLSGKEPLVRELAARVGYQGRKMKLKVADSVDVSDDAHWAGGTRSTYTFVRLADLAVLPAPVADAPWNQPKSAVVPLVPGMVCIEHSVFCGKDAGITIYAGPGTVTPLLPAADAGGALSTDELIVLYAARAWKSFGRLAEAVAESGISPSRYELAKVALIEKKLLTRSGALNMAGKNVAANLNRCPKAEVA